MDTFQFGYYRFIEPFELSRAGFALLRAAKPCAHWSDRSDFARITLRLVLPAKVLGDENLESRSRARYEIW